MNTRWEYRLAEVAFGPDGSYNLGSIGAEGWEAVAMHVDEVDMRGEHPALEKRHIIVLFKRPRPDEHPEPRVRAI